METENIVLPEKPIEFEGVRCPNCGHNITTSFNSYRIVLFTKARQEYFERQKRIDTFRNGKPYHQIKERIEKYEQGKETASFDFCCKGVCGQQLKFVMHNTLTGETKMKGDRPVLIVRPNPKEVPNDF